MGSEDTGHRLLFSDFIDGPCGEVSFCTVPVVSWSSTWHKNPSSPPLGVRRLVERSLPWNFCFMVYVGFLISACLVSFAYFILRVVVSEFPPAVYSAHTPNKCKAPEKFKQSPTHPHNYSQLLVFRDGGDYGGAAGRDVRLAQEMHHLRWHDVKIKVGGGYSLKSVCIWCPNLSI